MGPYSTWRWSSDAVSRSLSAVSIQASNAWCDAQAVITSASGWLSRRRRAGAHRLRRVLARCSLQDELEQDPVFVAQPAVLLDPVQEPVMVAEADAPRLAARPTPPSSIRRGTPFTVASRAGGRRCHC